MMGSNLCCRDLRRWIYQRRDMILSNDQRRRTMTYHGDMTSKSGISCERSHCHEDDQIRFSRCSMRANQC